MPQFLRAVRRPFASVLIAVVAVGGVMVTAGSTFAKPFARPFARGARAAFWKTRPPVPPPRASRAASMLTGDTVVLFGPLTVSTPVAQTVGFQAETFTTPGTAGRRYVAIIDKGAPMANRARVKINRTAICDSADFVASNHLEKLIALRGTDSLDITVRGDANASVTLKIISIPDPTYTIHGPTWRAASLGTSTYTDTFPVVSPPAKPPYYLYVLNGETGTYDRATGLSMTVNGTSVPVPADFNQNIRGFVVPVTINESPAVFVANVTGSSGAAVQFRFVATDSIPPVITWTAPTAGAITNQTSVTVTGSVTDSTLATVLVNGAAPTMTGNAFSKSVSLSSEGNNTITVRAVDGADHITDSTRTIIRDTTAPSLTITVPVEGLSTSNASLAVTGTVSDATATTVNVNGTPLTVTSGAITGTFTLANHLNTLSFAATDAAGNVTTVVRHVRLDTQASTLTVSAPTNGTTTTNDSITVSGTVVDSSTVTVNANGVNLPVSSGAFTGKVALIAGANTIAVTATDAAGNQSSTSRSVTKQMTVTVNGPLPIDSSLGAPALPTGYTATMLDATSFLYTGGSPIQTGVSAGTIKLERAAVVRGRVLTAGGTPLSGVTVTIAGHPEFGSTTTRSNGLYDMAVNGGERLRVSFAKTSYLSAERAVEVPWQQYAVADDQVLLQLDAASTVVDFSDPIEVARGSVITDARGTRQATMMFEQGTTATLVMPNGSTSSASSLTVRATEYTNGVLGPSAMPAPLPATSAYTYAVELSADEAIAAGAKSITFSKPVAVYVDNFIDFKVGETVPVGSLDRGRGVWVPESDGRVVKIVAINSGRADIAVDSTGTAADSATRAALGITDAERDQLGALYSVGTMLWRVDVTHFTAFDNNWWFNQQANQVPGSTLRQTGDPLGPCDPNMQGGSIIRCESQQLGERIPLPGTGLELSYESSRVLGNHSGAILGARLLADTVPVSLDSIAVRVVVAGRKFAWIYKGGQLVAGLTHRSDVAAALGGVDAYGRATTIGSVDAVGAATYYFSAGYLSAPAGSGPATFGRPPVDTASRCNHACVGTIAPSVGFRQTVSLRDARAMYGLGGWSLSPHHAYDAIAHALSMGDGTTRSTTSVGQLVSTAAGTGVGGSSGNGGPATSATLTDAHSILVGPDRSLYIDGYSVARIRRVSPGGIIDTVGPALNGSLYLSMGPDGNLYTTNSHVVYRINPSTGDTTRIAGGGLDFTGEGIPATGTGSVRFFGIGGIVAAPDGSIYVYNGNNHQVRRIMPNGRVYTAAGNGQSCSTQPAADPATGSPATQVPICSGIAAYSLLAMTPDGVLYILDFQPSRTVLRQLGLDGRLRTVAGLGSCSPSTCGDGGPALTAGLVSFGAFGISAGPDGSIYLPSIGRVRRITPDGVINTVLGTPTGSSYSGDGKPPLQTTVGFISQVAVSPDGIVYAMDQTAPRVIAMTIGTPGVAPSQTVKFASQDGSQVYVFDGTTGQHLHTLDAFTNKKLYEFTYDGAGRITQVKDIDGNITTINRDGAGKPTAVTGPFGQRDSLTLDARGYLASVKNRANEAITIQHDSLGLLKQWTDAKGTPPHKFTYDTLGRLTKDEDPAAGYKTLARSETDSSTTVTVSTALGRTTSYLTTRGPDRVVRRTTTDPAGLATRRATKPDLTSTATLPDSTVITSVIGADPRFGMQTPVRTSGTITLPSGLQSSMRRVRVTTLSDPADPLSLVSMTDTVVRNGRTSRSTYVISTRTHTSTSAEGRQRITVRDTLGRIIERRRNGYAPVRFTYGARGLLTDIAQAGRSLHYAYDSAGRIASAQDVLGRVESFIYDSAGRVTRQTLPDLREINYTYDANGNLASITPPSRSAHTFTYTARNQDSIYTPPSVGLTTPATRYAYDLDRNLTLITRPDSHTIAVGYDSFGRPNTVTLPSGSIGLSYDGQGRLSRVSGPQGDTVSLGYDGFLMKTTTWAGPVHGSIGYTYDANFRVTAMTVNSANSISFGYDQDNLLTSAGSLALLRDTGNGRIVRATLGSDTTSFTYDDSIGTVSTNVSKHGATNLYSGTYSRDSIGRMASIVETIQGVSRTVAYAYDTLGRLDQVRVGGTLVADYDYDANGNRVQVATSGGTVSGTTDDQDRLLTYGMATFTYTANGERRRRIAGTDTTAYQYDGLGNLVQVRLPAGATIDYVFDGRGRRIGRKVNGTLVQGFLYQGQLRPIAELDGSGQVVSRFVYATRRNVPEYLIKGGTTYRLVTDHVGSVRLVVNTSNGTIVQRIDYDEFGQITTNTSPGFQPFGFAGGILDDSTHLVHFGARDYDPEPGRWLTKDPVGFGAQATNLYEYAFNDPVNAVDLDGLQAGVLTAGRIVGGAAGGAIAGGLLGPEAIPIGVRVGAIAGAAGAAALVVWWQNRREWDDDEQDYWDDVQDDFLDDADDCPRFRGGSQDQRDKDFKRLAKEFGTDEEEEGLIHREMEKVKKGLDNLPYEEMRDIFQQILGRNGPPGPPQP